MRHFYTESTKDTTDRLQLDLNRVHLITYCGKNRLAIFYQTGIQIYPTQTSIQLPKNTSSVTCFKMTNKTDFLLILGYSNGCTILFDLSKEKPVEKDIFTVDGATIDAITHNSSLLTITKKGHQHLLSVRQRPADNPRLLSKITGPVITASEKGRLAY